MINKLDRVVINTNYVHFESKIEAGTIGTAREFLADDLVIVQYDYNYEKQEPIFAGLPVSILTKINTSELYQVSDHNALIPPSYHVGNMLLMNKGDFESQIGIIESIELAINERDDKITLKFKDQYTVYTRDFLDVFSNFIGTCNEGTEQPLEQPSNILAEFPTGVTEEDIRRSGVTFEIPEPNVELRTIQIPEQDVEPKTIINQDLNKVIIIINGFRFVVDPNNFEVNSSFKKNESHQFLEAISILDKIFKN